MIQDFTTSGPGVFENICLSPSHKDRAKQGFGLSEQTSQFNSKNFFSNLDHS